MSEKESTKLTLLGLGGAGIQILQRLTEREQPENWTLAAVDADQKSANQLDNAESVILGADEKFAHGCGGDVEIGETLAAESTGNFKTMVQSSQLCVITAGLGGGTGTGACKFVARLLDELQIPSFFIVTTPFIFEGNWRRSQANGALETLRDSECATIAVENDLLFTSISADTPAPQAFNTSAQILAEITADIAGTITADWLLNTDFSVLFSLLRKHTGICAVGTGNGSGENRWDEALNSFKTCPFIGGQYTFTSADPIILLVKGGDDLVFGQLQSYLPSLNENFSEHAKIITGIQTEYKYRGKLRITGIFCLHNDEVSKQTSTPALSGEEELPAWSKDAETNTRQIPSGSDSRIQEELPLQETSLGKFSSSSPTTFQGENLDIPTFQRRNVPLDQGD